jgi:glycine oxidase
MGSDVVIAGGGVVGLSIAYVLAREGLSVAVFDAAALARGASWAGAGIIAPEAERPPSSPLAALRSLSAHLHPAWSQALREETGIDNGYRRCGGVDVAANEDEDKALRALAGRWREEGIAWERIPARDFSRVEPALNPDLLAAYFLPDRAQIRNPRHLQALIAACERRDVSLIPEHGIVGLQIIHGRVTGARTAHDLIPCGHAIIAAGPWSSQLLETLGLNVPTPPVRGQIALLKAVAPLLRRIVEHGRNYLVPRDDGRVLVGSTEENVGFDARTTSVAIHDLLAEAIRLCPALAAHELERAWAGLRPGSVDARPYIGPVADVQNLFVATGHNRAGLQLSPGTAELIADLVLGRAPRIDLTPFRLTREPAFEDDVFRS